MVDNTEYLVLSSYLSLHEIERSEDLYSMLNRHNYLLKHNRPFMILEANSTRIHSLLIDRQDVPEVEEAQHKRKIW
jgi:hypothetical protein